MAGKVGFIGLGAMGGPMALNLAKAGFALVVHDIDKAKTEPLNAKGAEVAASAQAVAAAVERTIVIVETTEQAESVIIGAHGIIRGAKPGHIVLCMSTIDPFAARTLRRPPGGARHRHARRAGERRHGTGPVGRAVGDRGRRRRGVRQVRGPVRRDGQPVVPCRRRWAAASP